MMKKRVIRVLEKYKDYDNVIVTCHGIMMQSITGMHDPAHGEVFEFKL